MATAREVISTLQNRGVTLEPNSDGGLRVVGISRLSERERVALRAHKAAILRALSLPLPGSTPVSASPAVTEPLPNRTTPPQPGSTQPFGQRELDAIRNGSGCWVWSAVLEEWLFWVRDEERKTKAQARGIDPGCIWTLPELTGVVGMPPERLRDIAAIRRKFSGAILPGAVPARWRSATHPLRPVVAEEVLA